MPKAGIKQSARRRATQAAKEEKAARKPVSAKSALATYLANPTGVNANRLMAAANRGELTNTDLQAAISQEMINMIALIGEDADTVNAKRPAHVLVQRLLKQLQEVVSVTGTTGPLLEVKVVFPDMFLGDRGDDVRTKSVAEEG